MLLLAWFAVRDIKETPTKTKQTLINALGNYLWNPPYSVVCMPDYQYVQIGFTPEQLQAIDDEYDNRSGYVRELVEDDLDL
jgi:hypothetical protein